MGQKISLGIGILSLIGLQIFCYLRPYWSTYSNGTIMGGSKNAKFYIYAPDGVNKTEIPNSTLPSTWNTKAFRAFQGMMISALCLLFLALLVALFSTSAGTIGTMILLAGLCIIISTIIWWRTMNINRGDSFTPPKQKPDVAKLGFNWIISLVGGIACFFMGLGLIIRRNSFGEEAPVDNP